MNTQYITKEDFLDYETVRKSGFHNMFDVQAIELSGLSRSKYVTIMDNYSELKNKYIGDDDDK